MSRGIWHGTLVYLGLKEEPEEGYDELPERFVPEHDPHAEHAPSRPTPLHDREPVGAMASSSPSSSSSAVTGEMPAQRRSANGAAGTAAAPAAAPGNVRALHPDVHVRALASAPAARVAVVEVVIFDDVEGIGSRYRTGQPVLFDLGGAPSATARRVVDFVSGLTYASRGKLSKVGKRAFLLVPDGVEVAEDDRRRLVELGYDLRSGA